MASPVAIREMRVRLFSEKKPPLDHPDLLRFHKDMLAGTPIKYDAGLLRDRNNNAYHEMSVELLEETGLDQVMQDVDVLLLAYNFPNSRPDISIVNYLMDRYQAGFISFAVNDLGFGAPFAALHMLQHYLGREGCTKGMLLVMDQTALPYETEELDSTAGPDTAAVIYLDRITGRGPSMLGVEMRHAENSIVDTAGMVLDRLGSGASIHGSQISLLMHPDLEKLCNQAAWYTECRSKSCYDPSRWSAAPFFALQELLEEKDNGEYICLMHLEQADSFVHALLIQTCESSIIGP
ncbi:hypothetical protein C0Q44_02970 [Paenibacillus sp. PCH8]|uniref:hypothetical protein n=1 Tax=Paenibacillus sp. PCH8 TaxID=2066524 RepID=UPI000CF8E094|nr:hypothetical protein [Paenibacillus sp. PCH8]PQP83667.1 hypothetical protein C0Q44_02970 [Paenibacillus sp. PCH8]